MLGPHQEQAVLWGPRTTARWDTVGAVCNTGGLLKLTTAARCSQGPCFQQAR